MSAGAPRAAASSLSQPDPPRPSTRRVRWSAAARFCSSRERGQRRGGCGQPVGEAGPEARRGHRRRHARRRPDLIVELAEVLGQARVLERSAVEPPRHRGGGAPGTRASILLHRRSRIEPRVAGIGDLGLEAVDPGLERAVGRDPDDEGRRPGGVRGRRASPRAFG